VLKIRRLTNGQVVFKLSGRMDGDAIAELETLIKLEGNGRPIILDLNDITLVGQDGITFLQRCEAESITLKNCAVYIREWIARQRGGS
jgi:anti-anti-sigma regulatory factor